jgi:hypothetical protein
MLAHLRTMQPSMRVVNLGLAVVPEEDSCSFITAVPCPLQPRTPQQVSDEPLRETLLPDDHPPYPYYSESQLTAALAALHRYGDAVTTISLSLGGGDLRRLATDVLTHGVEDARSQSAQTLARLEANYGSALARIRAAAPQATILLMDAIDPYAAMSPSLFRGATVSLADIESVVRPAYGEFAGYVRAEAVRSNAVYVDVHQVFRGQESQLLSVAEGSDLPTTSGYRLYARTMWQRYQRALQRRLQRSTSVMARA